MCRSHYARFWNLDTYYGKEPRVGHERLKVGTLFIVILESGVLWCSTYILENQWLGMMETWGRRAKHDEKGKGVAITPRTTREQKCAGQATQFFKSRILVAIQ